MFVITTSKNMIQSIYYIKHVSLFVVLMQVSRFTINLLLPIFSSFTTYHRSGNNINTTDSTRGTGTSYPSGAPEFIPDFSGFHVTRSLVLCVCFVDSCLSFCLFFPFGFCVVCSSWIYGFWLQPLVSSISSYWHFHSFFEGATRKISCMLTV